jgi:hypothetical protein
MKMLHLFIAVFAIIAVLLTPAYGQTRATATQTVTLAVNAIYKLSVLGNPSLTIADASAGSGSMTTVSDAASSFSITQNRPTGRLSVQMSSALPTGLTLTVSVPSVLGTSLGIVSIGDANSHNVMTGLAQGATNGQPITYTFGALVSADPLPSTAYTVTWTLAD